MNIVNSQTRHHSFTVVSVAVLGVICTFPLAVRAQGNNISGLEAGTASTEPPDYDAYEWSLPREWYRLRA